MKKSTVWICALLVLLVATSGFAQMDQVILTSSQITTNVGTGTGVCKGEIFSIRLDTTTAKTNAVAITTAEGETLLSVAALTADATYYPLVQANLASDGTAATLLAGTNNYENAVLVRQAVASDLTMTVTPASGTTGTNTVRAIITIKK